MPNINFAKGKSGKSLLGMIPLEFGEQANGAASVPDVIQMVPVGQWDHPAYGPIVITGSDIREFSQNFNAGIRKGVFITAGHEGFAELPAVGWVKETEVRDDGLWGTIEWNELGKQTLSDKQFKFFSPEFYQTYEDPETRQIYRNVLTGGALTKSPYFKELEAIVFSEPKSNEPRDSMNLQELLAKKLEELSDDEKAFIKANQSELTEEQKTALTSVLDEAETPEAKEARETAEKAAADAKALEEANVAAGKNADGTEKVSASEKVQITAGELAILRAAADKGVKAFAELEKQKISAETAKLVMSESNTKGVFLPKQAEAVKTFMATLNETQRATFSTLVAQIPTKLQFGEAGSSAAAVHGDATAELNALVDKKMKADPKLRYSDALRQVVAENDGLEERFDRELVPLRGKA